ncbi:MAG: type II secretion system F family protein [Kiritimatiellia bacterium]
MKTYEYKGFQASGHAARGLIEASGLKDARERLASGGILVETISPAAVRRRRIFFRLERGFNAETRSSVYRELSSMMKAGLTLTQSLQLLIEATGESPGTKLLLAGLRDRVQEGASMAQALSETGGGTHAMELAAVRAGERAGNLDAVLERLASFLEDQNAVQERVQTALIYPSIILGMALLIAMLMFGVMIPRFAVLFEESQIKLPAITVWILAAGRVLKYVLTALIVAIVALAAFFALKSKDLQYRIRADRIKYRIPLWGRGYAALVNFRFAQTLSLLLEGGVPMVEAFPLAGQATGSPWVADRTGIEAESLSRHGSSLSDAVRRIEPLDDVLPGWIQAGEASGALPDLLAKAGMRYQMRWQRMIGRSLEVLEPVLIIFVGALVLLLALAVLTPILSLNSSLM